MNGNEKNGIEIVGKPLKLTHEYPYRIGFMSDLQVACEMGLVPPESAGFGFKPNVIGETLWTYVEDFIAKMKEHKVQLLLVVGDLVSGQNYAELGDYLYTDQFDIQKKMCAWILKYIYDKVGTIEKIVIWEGTPYHGRRGGDKIEDDVATLLQTKKYGNIDAEFAGMYSWLTFEWKGKKKLWWVAHPATSAVCYPETMLGRDIMFFQQAYAEDKLPKVDRIVRAHTHSFMELHKGGVHYLVLPCWQSFVPYDKAVKYYSKFQPDIGGVIVLLDEELRSNVWHFLYPNIPDPTKHIIVRVHASVPKRSKKNREEWTNKKRKVD